MICAAVPKLTEPAIIDCVVGCASVCGRAAIMRSGVGRATRSGFASAGGSAGGSGGTGSATASGSAVATDCGAASGTAISTGGTGGTKTAVAGTAACCSGGTATGATTATGPGTNINCTPVGSLPASSARLCTSSATTTNARTWPETDSVTVRLVALRANRRVTPNLSTANPPIRTGSIACAARHDGSLLTVYRQPRVCPADGSKIAVRACPSACHGHPVALPARTARQFGTRQPDAALDHGVHSRCDRSKAATIIYLLGQRFASVSMPPSAANPIREEAAQGMHEDYG